MPKGKLILLPNLLDESLDAGPFLPASLKETVLQIEGLIAESEKSARRYLLRFIPRDKMVTLPLKLLNEHTPQNEIKALLEPLIQGQTWGLISDAGLPCIADPGADLVRAARLSFIEIEAVSGPCSLILALQLSGFSGQRFRFHGYLPREALDLEKTVKDLEKAALGETQIWIEAPYRSAKMLELLKSSLQPSTYLSLAVNLTMPTQRVVSQAIQNWRSTQFELGKEPAVFLIFRFS